MVDVYGSAKRGPPGPAGESGPPGKKGKDALDLSKWCPDSEIRIFQENDACYVMLCYDSGIWRIMTTTPSRPRVLEALADLQTSIPAPTPSLASAKRDPPGPAGPYRPKTGEAMSYLWKALGAQQ